MPTAIRHLPDPGTLTVSTGNSIASGQHTHAITASASITGATTSLLKSDSSGYLRLVRMGLGTAPSYPLDVSGNMRVKAGGWIYIVDSAGTDTAAIREQGGSLLIQDDTNQIRFMPKGGQSTYQDYDAWYTGGNNNYDSTFQLLGRYADGGSGAARYWNMWVDGSAQEFKISDASATVNMRITMDGDIGFGGITPAAKLHIKQGGAARAIPGLEIEQDDDDEPFIDFDGTSAADQTKNISTVNGDGAVQGPKDFATTAGWNFEGMIRVSINGTDRWMPYYSEDTS